MLRYYTPAVCYGAVALALLPPIDPRSFLHNSAANGVIWIYQSADLPGYQLPVCTWSSAFRSSFFAGIGGASNAGVLVKGSNYLETLAQTKYVVFDKTGTHDTGCV